MKINVNLEDVILPVECGEGRQKLKWLATVACTRYGLLQSEPPSLLSLSLSVAPGQRLLRSLTAAARRPPPSHTAQPPRH